MFTKYNENWNRGATGEICIRTQEAEIHLSVSINLLIRNSLNKLHLLTPQDL